MDNSTPLSIEDARPVSLGEVAGQRAALERLQALLDTFQRSRIVPPSVILWGPAGVGKTTVARAFGRQALGTQWENSFNELGASDDRSLRFIKDRVGAVAGRPPTRGAPFRMVFFDEADQLADDAQAALRPLMESAAGTCVFILACNDLSKISQPLQSRCVVLEFGTLSASDLKRVVEHAGARLGLSTDGPMLTAIVAESNGIPRNAVKLLIERAVTPEHGGSESDL